MTPSPLVAVLLGLAVLRTYRLAALDTLPVLVKARDWVLGYRVVGERFLAPDRHEVVTEVERPLLAEWLTCVWCSGLWYAAAWYAGWLVEPTWAVYAAVPLALSAAAGCVQALLPD